MKAFIDQVLFMIPERIKVCRDLLFILSSLIITACATSPRLAAPPNLYQNSHGFPAEVATPGEQSSVASLIYMTDRALDVESEAGLDYSDQRSASMAFGMSSLEIGKDQSWQDVVASATNPDERPEIYLKNLSEVGRFPPTPITFEIIDGRAREDAGEREDYDAAANVFKQLVRERLQEETRKDVIVFVHGFNNSFSDAAMALTDIYHFTGRYGVPLLYSWPSGSGSLLGYFTDRESGEFTVFHLKETLRILSSMPEVENIHILAHSRGTDVTTTALRELVIESRAGGHDPRKKLKVENLILAAPDLDYGVVKQRLVAEKFGAAFGQINIYMNSGDNALGLSQILMNGVRFGRLTREQQSARADRIFRNVGNVSFINVEGVSGFTGHGYFREHPGVLSDIIQIITRSARPGSEERPLKRQESNFWTLGHNYLLNAEAF